MVKVIYAPPHRDAPFTHHSMPGFGPRLGQKNRFTLWLIKQPQSRVILSAVGITMAICAIPQTVRATCAFLCDCSTRPNRKFFELFC